MIFHEQDMGLIHRLRGLPRPRAHLFSDCDQSYLAGFPSVGKSTLLTQLTGTKSETAAYEFTTLTCIPGVIHYNNAKIQLLDLPGIIEGAAEGKGRGRQVIAVAKSADLVLMVLDASKISPLHLDAVPC